MLTFLLAKLDLLFFAAPGDPCTLHHKTFFFFPSWWKYLKGQKDPIGICAPHVNFPGDFWLIGLAVLDMLLRLAGFVAVLSIILAGAQLVTAEGNPEKATNARNRLINSLIGLAIAVSAIAFVAFVGAHVGGGGTGLPHTATNQATIQSLLNIVFAILGALAFLFIVLAGFRFITSGDNPQKVAEARRQIIYAGLGLVIIALAATIVNFVLGKIT